MNSGPPPIRIAAALITDRKGCLLLVRKVGTRWFMQAGGKIEPGEDALSALQRELYEEINVTFDASDAHPLGRFEAPAANETGQMVQAELFHLRLTTACLPVSEIEEVIWVTPEAAEGLPLAPLTRDHLLPLVRAMKPIL
ncbi:NUDIX domain-containing protein [Aureimonas sp. AU12]|uniref:NUDIX hydrolase n=1 Tax=Aureimonas sp. AU12 TaxID=1638161 RepID=UPI00078150A7|nr:NUDIX domain-containing protein [Aureimonas sp. AU12]